MQKCKCGGAACKGANVRGSAQGETGNRMIGWGTYIFGCRVTGTGIRSSGAGRSAIWGWRPSSGG